MSEQPMNVDVRAWLRDRVDARPPASPIVASVMAALDATPQRRPGVRRGPFAGPMGARLVDPATTRRWGVVVTLAAVALVLAAAVALLIATSHPPPPLGGAFAQTTVVTWSPDGSRLAFVVDDDLPLSALKPSPSFSYIPKNTLAGEGVLVADDESSRAR